MDVGTTILVMQRKYIREALAERLRRKRPSGIVQTKRISTGRHAQNYRAGHGAISAPARVQGMVGAPLGGEHLDRFPPRITLAIGPFEDELPVPADVVQMTQQMTGVGRPACDLHHHLRRSADDPGELGVCGRIPCDTRWTEDRSGDPGATSVDRRAKRLLESERLSEVAHGSADQ
nr:hypothetical protein [uncultured Brevundimonas sp.]